MSDEALTRSVILRNPQGLHMRPAGEFVASAAKFSCEVFVRNENVRVDGKRILEMLKLAAGPGTELVVETTGDDALQALDVLCRVLEQEGSEPPATEETDSSATSL